jgi:hypothetical protein
LFCRHGQRGGCIISVWSTPRNPHNHAQAIIRQANKRPH